MKRLASNQHFLNVASIAAKNSGGRNGLEANSYACSLGLARSLCEACTKLARIRRVTLIVHASNVGANLAPCLRGACAELARSFRGAFAELARSLRGFAVLL